MFALLLLCAIGANADPAADKLTEALKPFQGKWMLERTLTTGDKFVRKPGENDIVLEFKGQKLLVNGNDAGEVLAVHNDIKPTGFDLRRVDVPEGGKADEAIYKIDGDKLTIAIYIGGERLRPANFDEPTKDGIVVAEFTKQP
jgi:uncharacterized protein (TIGR03067 family)